MTPKAPACPNCGASMLPSFSLRTFWCDECGHVNDPEQTREAVERRAKAAPCCDRCGKEKYLHTGPEQFCPFISTYRAALSSSGASPTDTNPTASSDPNPEGNRRE